jgi:hypothetical protein
MRRVHEAIDGIRRAVRRTVPAMLLACAGCSSPPVEPHTSPSPTLTAPAPKADARSRLQGTWELVTFISLGPIPDEAVPILASLHGAVRLRFDGDRVITFIPGTPDQEACGYEIVSEEGDAFTLVTTAGMFRRAQSHFVAHDLWEATENGPTWPGTTRFQRVTK